VSPGLSLLSRCRQALSRPHLALIGLIGVLVPKRLRADWRQEWQAELRWREQRLARWDRPAAGQKWELLRRSSGAFRDALWLQTQRREDEMVQDLTLGLRMLVKHPAFTCVAVLMLAVGIGANTAVFTFVDALLLRPLPGVVQPDRLVQVGRQYPDKPYLSDSSYPDFLDYRAHNTVLSGLAAMSPTAFHVSHGGETERVDGELVSSGYFDVLGTTVAVGRAISPADARESVAVLSHRFWQRRFAGSPSVVGTKVTLNGRAFTVIGVADPAFAGIKIGAPRDVWIPLEAAPSIEPGLAPRFEQRRASWLEMVGRLAPGVTVDGARSELAVLAKRLETSHPDTNARAGVGVEPGLGRDVDVRRAMRRFAYVPIAAAGLVLLMTCGNVAALLLARSIARRKEMATRLALGARRGRLVRQLLTESLVLATAGGLAGLVVGSWLTRGLRGLLPDRFLFLSFDLALGVDWRVFGFMLALATATGLLFGLMPALQASRPELVSALKGGSLLAGRREMRWRSVLVVSQLAVSVVLLAAAGLCVRSLRNAVAIETGYAAGAVLTARVDLARQSYDETRGRQFHQQLVERVEALPGVESAAFAVTLPLNDGRWSESVRRDGDPTRVQTFQNAVSARYFSVMDIPIVTGRSFADGDDADAPPVAIVNGTLARLLWPGEPVLGRRVTVKGRSIDIVGVARDIKGRDLFEAADPILYLPLSQSYQPNAVLHVRTAVPPLSVAAAVRREVAALDQDLPVYALKSLDEHVTATLTPQRLLAGLIGGFGVLALALAALGLYGLVAHAVTERRAEIGLRMALGAHQADVVRLFVAQGMTLALAGILAGTLAAFLLTPAMAGLLVGVDPADPLTWLMTPGILLVAALMACAGPAYRAARADPTSAFRAE
jgi:predicted permease